MPDLAATVKLGPFSLVAVVAIAILAGCAKEEPLPRATYVYEPVRHASAFIALVEQPEAKTALLLGADAAPLAKILEHAGLRVAAPDATNAAPSAAAAPEGPFDIVLAEGEPLTYAACRAAMARLAENGVLLWTLDVAGASVGRFRDMLRAFVPESQHLWMPGEGRWLVAGRRQRRAVPLAAMLDVFTREQVFADMAKAHCTSLPEIFASYAGTREDVMPAFALLDLSATVGPQNFLTREVEPVGWIDATGIDADIARAVHAETRSMQVVRRLVVEGDLAAAVATDKKGEEAAAEIWARAALRNPNDLLLLERLDRLERNARGFLEVGRVIQAMKCYETLVLVRPDDATAVHNFGMCLKRLGKLDVAEKALERARRLSGGRSL